MQKYSHSGTVPLGGAIWTTLFGLAAAVIGGVVYAYAFHWIGVAWFIRLGLAFIYALVVGCTISGVANRTKIRSPLFVTVVGLLCTAVGLWVYWGAYNWACNGPQVGVAAWTPQGLVEQGRDLFANGSWTFKRKVVRGWPLVAFWVGEALTGLWLVVTLARSDADRPFCETCLEWTNPTKGLMNLSATGHEPVWGEVLAGELPAIAEFSPARGTHPATVRLDLASCPKCEQSSFVTLTAITTSTDSKGKTKTTERAMIVNGALTATEAEFLRQFAQQLTTEPGDSEAADAASDEQEDALE